MLLSFEVNFIRYNIFKLTERHHISIQKPHTLKLKNDTRNITVDCHGYGKPLPTVLWKKDNKTIKNVSDFSESYNDQVVQVLEYASSSQWNVTNRLYLRMGGITYNESGNYTCEVFNGVGTNYSEEQSIEVVCKCIFCCTFTVMLQLHLSCAFIYPSLLPLVKIKVRELYYNLCQEPVMFSPLFVCREDISKKYWTDFHVRL